MLIFLSLSIRMSVVFSYDDTAENDLWLLWCHVWESGRENIGAIKRHRGPSPVADCFPPSKIHRVRASVCLRIHMRPHVSVCVCAYICVCSGADDRGHGLHTRGTANEKEAFPLTFHGSQKQFAQWKVAKQPQCLSPEPGRRKEEIQILDPSKEAGCSHSETKCNFT